VGKGASLFDGLVERSRLKSGPDCSKNDDLYLIGSFLVHYKLTNNNVKKEWKSVNVQKKLVSFLSLAEPLIDVFSMFRWFPFMQFLLFPRNDDLCVIQNFLQRI